MRVLPRRFTDRTEAEATQAATIAQPNQNGKPTRVWAVVNQLADRWLEVQAGTPSVPFRNITMGD
jgi:hypothetical protein